MYFDFNLVPLIGIGGVVIVFAKKFASSVNMKILIGEENWRKIYTWAIRLIGIVWVAFAIGLATDEGTRYGKMMSEDLRQLLILEKGKLATAEVSRFFYQKGAPEGWAISYEFTARNPKTNQQETYRGSSQGPKKYFVDTNEVTVIYDPCEPKLNLEIRCFLNKPTFRKTFEKEGKLHLLDKYRDICELEEYTFSEWYEQQQSNPNSARW